MDKTDITSSFAIARSATMREYGMALRKIEKTYANYWGYYWRITHRHTIENIFAWDENLVRLIEQTCDLQPASKVLDLGCAGGDQAVVFARKGHHVTGVDLVPSLIAYARDRFEDEQLPGDFYVQDMREIEWEDHFDLCVILSGSFGFFNDSENKRLLESIRTALKPNGKLFLNYLPVESMASIGFSRTWHPVDSGFSLSETWYDSQCSTYNSTHMHIMDTGTMIVPASEPGYHANERIRCYSLKEMDQLLDSAGFAVLQWLTKKHIDEPEHSPQPWDTCNSVVAQC